MSRPLAEPVYVAGRFFAAGDVPPQEFADLISNPRAWGSADVDAGPALDRHSTAVAYDPGADGEGVDEVNNYLANADEDEVRRVLAAEAAGKKRKGILDGPYAIEDPAV